jgi:hypothetical protein
MATCNYKDRTGKLCGRKALYREGAAHRCSDHRDTTPRRVAHREAVRESIALANERESRNQRRDALRRQRGR